MPSAVVFIAEGTEEMEFTIVYDTLVRAGIQCTSVYVPTGETASQISGGQVIVTCSRGVKIVPDSSLPDFKDGVLHDLIVVPGGAKGAETISNNPTVQNLIRKHFDEKKWVGMICAGSMAALKSGLPRQPLTSHPSVKEHLEKQFEYRADPVVVSGNLITSRGPGTAFPFGLTLVECLLGKEKKLEVEGPMIFPGASV